MTEGFVEVGNSSMEGDGERRAVLPSPEPGRQGPTPPAGGVGVGPKLLDAPEGRRNGCVGSGPSSLDYSKHNCNRGCGARSLTGPTQLNGQAFQAFARLRCKSWSCARCGPAKAFKLQKAVAEKARDNDLTRLLTLTLDPKTVPDGVDQIRYIRNVWRKFRVYLTRRFGRSVSYIAILELHQSGRPHLHILVNRYIPQSWISETWENLGGGRICHIERVTDIHRIGNYLAKYLTKTAILSVPPGARRYTTSRDIHLFEKVIAKGWGVLSTSIEELYRRARHNVLHTMYECDGAIRSFATRTLWEVLRTSPG